MYVHFLYYLFIHLFSEITNNVSIVVVYDIYDLSIFAKPAYNIPYHTNLLYNRIYFHFLECIPLPTRSCRHEALL